MLDDGAALDADPALEATSGGFSDDACATGAVPLFEFAPHAATTMHDAETSALDTKTALEACLDTRRR